MSPTAARRLASALVPEAGKRMIDGVRNRRAMALMAPANHEFVARHGLDVSGGPFAGMRYLPGQERIQGDLVPKLLGSYEAELHDAIADWAQAAPALVANVGCAEGYYAVGIARALAATRVLAYDIDPAARDLCTQLAALNGVADRVELHGECTPETLSQLPSEGVALLCDCEGYELTLLDPERIPRLRGWSIIVELHDFVDPAITPTIQRRFSASHDVEIIRSVGAHAPPSELDFMSPRQRELVLSERPVAMNWGVLTPRA